MSSPFPERTFFYVRGVSAAEDAEQEARGDGGADEAPAENGSQDGDDQGKRRDDHGRFIGHALDFAHIAGHIHGQRCQFQADDGYVAYQLRSGQAEDEEMLWGQTLSGDNADVYPVLGGETVYRSETSGVTWYPDDCLCCDPCYFYS